MNVGRSLSPLRDPLGSVLLFVWNDFNWALSLRIDCLNEERLKFHTKFGSKFESVNLKHSIG